MASFEVETFIQNRPEIVFDLSRSIDLHIISTCKSKEKAVAGITTGLIGLNETVTWQAFHLFKLRKFTSLITTFDFPFSFTDEMTEGDLKSFSHTHSFENSNGGTLMKDRITLTAPFGLLGKTAMVLFLKNYFRKLIIERNAVIKAYAESDKALMILKNKSS